MTRADEGRYVNLSTDRDPDDFYGRVASAAWQANPKVQTIMRDEYDRAIVKQPAMSYFYGSKAGGWAKQNGRLRPFGMTKQIVDVRKERGQPPKGAKDLARTTHRVIEAMVPRAKAVRDFLEQLAKLLADHGKSLAWTTPTGLKVFNRYHKPDVRRISVSLRGRRRQVNLTVGDRPEIGKQNAVNAVTANFTHSSDATHLQLVALAAAKEEIQLVTVHDCFGTIAPNAGRMLDIIREQFVKMHKRHNWLNSVRESARHDLPGVELPPAPDIGNLDIDAVLASHNAFK